jgi:tetratricopeptide (TPR) repeat protein
MKTAEVLDDWLQANGLESLTSVLSDADVDLPMLLDLESQDFVALGISFGNRKRLLSAIEAHRNGVATSVPAVEIEASTSAPAATKTLKLFLSYGRDDHAAEVRALRDALRVRGHEVWFDEEQLGSGLDWEQRIEKGLAWCDRVVLTMTPHSVRRPDGYCLNEIAKALELRKTIIPVLLVEVPQGAPTSICRIQYLDWRDAVPAAEKIDRFTQRLSRLCEAIEEDKLDFEGGQQWLIRHLQPINFDGDLQRHVASFKGRVQLEARLRQWLADPQGSQVMWLTAAPGLGKSAVAATLAHRWAEVAAVHFCVAGQQDKANPARAVLSIAYQLSQRQHMSLYAARLSNLELEREALKDARTLFDTLLVGQLAKGFPEPPEPILVVLDGLDEATQPDGENPLAEIVAADWGRLPRWLRLMVSSRPEAELVSWLSGTQRIEIRGGDAEQQADLAAFLRERLTAIDRPPSDETLNRILDRSEGAFHYAVLLIEEVRQGRCDPDNPVDLPAGLNPFYLQTFKRRFSDIKAYRNQTRPLLELILAAPEPVPLAVLAGSTNREAQDVRQDLSALGSMLTIEPGQGENDIDWDTVRLSHASLRSWLTGLDETRQPLAGAYAAKVNTGGLAAEVLRLWAAGNDPSQDVQDAGIERKGFVARTLWGLLKGIGDEAAMERVAFDLSLYWEHRALGVALAPGEHAAQVSERDASEPDASVDFVKRAGKCLCHLGELLEAMGRSARALEMFEKFLSIAERLAEKDPANAGWQRELGESYNRIGGVLKTQGDLAGALGIFEKHLAISERLAEQDSANAGWQRDLGVSYNRIGDVLETQGDLTGALKMFEKGLAVLKRLAEQDPANAGWQRNLSLSYSRIGDVLGTQGDLAVALEMFEKYRAIFRSLAEQDPANAGWQRELGVSYNRIGGVLETQGDLTGALEMFEKSLAIFKRLAGQDPANAGWQRNLGVSYNRIGVVLETQSDLAGALEMFEKHLAISERLAEQDPTNAGWLQDLGLSYSRIGGVLETQGDLAGALEMFEKWLAIAERLAEKDPANAGWQRDLGVSYIRIGGVLEAKRDFKGALNAHQSFLNLSLAVLSRNPEYARAQRDVAIGEASTAHVELALGNLGSAAALQAEAASAFALLRNVDEAASQFDWAAVTALGAEIAQAAGHLQTVVLLQDQLINIELRKDALVGNFRNRFLPLILKHLDAAAQRADATQRSRIVNTVMQFAPK